MNYYDILSQNAGCNHLHHAHCLGARWRDSDRIHFPCPTGCPIEKVHREPTEFNAQEPHLTLVWSGDRVEKIPILKARSGDFITLSTDEVISIVQAFLTKNDSKVPGLSLRIYSRDPVAE